VFTSLKNLIGEPIANICRGSRKDLRDSIVSNRKAQSGWAKRSAYNKGQILYRIAETLEGRKAQFVESFIRQGLLPAAAIQETEAAIDLLVYYAGWCDKYIQVFSSVNPVESSHFNFSYHEPMGVADGYCSGRKWITRPGCGHCSDDCRRKCHALFWPAKNIR
jgi:acyl-CoA reductase-like NAD-dependent aldehyde dehydrogenase